MSAYEPAIYPSRDIDAEEYITRRKHDEPLSKEIGKLYALILDKELYVYYDEKEGKGNYTQS